MILKYTNYSDGVHDINFEESDKSVGLEEPFSGKISVACKMDKSHSQIVLNCKISAEVSYTCDRCADSFDSVLETQFQSIYLFQEEDEEKSDNVYFLSLDSDKIDIQPEVEEFSRLAIPLKVLCNDECKGLCYKCGSNLNLSDCSCDDESDNPIWEPLKKLKDNIN